MKAIILIGIILLSINVSRFLIGNINILKNDKLPIFLKIWNVFESLYISIILILLILKYYNL